VLQGVAGCCSVLSSIAMLKYFAEYYRVSQCTAVCCRVREMQEEEEAAHSHIRVTPSPCCSVLQRVAACCSVLQYVAVRHSASQCVAVRCSVVQCAAVPPPSRLCIQGCDGSGSHVSQDSQRG